MFLTRSSFVAYLFAVTLAAISSAAVAAPTWSVDSLNTIGCSGSATSFSTTLSGYTGGNEHWRTIVTAAGVRYMDEDAGQVASDGPWNWSLYSNTSGGPAPGTWPLPSNTPITVDFMLIAGAGGQPVFHRQVVLSQCNGGTIVGNIVLTLASVPTLDRTGLAFMVTLLASVAFVILRRRTT
jgi:hypothetical protein